MPHLPVLKGREIIAALLKVGYVQTRQKGSHIRLSRFADGRLRKLTVPAHRPLKRSTLVKIIKQANLSVEEFLDLLKLN